MNALLSNLSIELFLVAAACVLFLLGTSAKAAARHMAPVIALTSLTCVFFFQLMQIEKPGAGGMGLPDPTGTITLGTFTEYVRLLVTGVGVVLVLLAWPTNRDATGSESLNFGQDAGEFFGLMLLSLTGVLLAAGANDIILLFLGVELASIPTYIMVSISRPLAVAQEAGVKYFFLGAMAAALMLFGFSYLYGTTGFTRLDQITAAIHGTDPATGGAANTLTQLTTWQVLAVVVLFTGFAFKIAAVPLHAYAGDVYQGAATPVTAFLAFVPKTSGFVALIKVLSAVGGASWSLPPLIVHLLWVIAALTMSVGNVLALIQLNVKRVLAYSSVAHTGYMLVGLTALTQATAAFPHDPDAAARIQGFALAGVLFYLAAYGIMNSGAFGVLMLLPSREPDDVGPLAGRGGRANSSQPQSPRAMTAETYDDLAGQGKRHVVIGLAMAVCCFSLIGIPLTVGFVGKVYLIQPALESKLFWLVVITVVNAAVSAAYYLKIVATMFLRPEPDADFAATPGTPGAAPTQTVTVSRGVAMVHHRAGLIHLAHAPFPLAAGVLLSVVGTILFGTVIPATNGLTRDVQNAAGMAPSEPATTARATPAPAVARAAR